MSFKGQGAVGVKDMMEAPYGDLSGPRRELAREYDRRIQRMLGTDGEPQQE